MRLDRLAIGGIALALTAATVLFATLEPGAVRRATEFSSEDPAASGRGALLLNPHCRHVPAPDFEQASNRALTGPFDDAAYGYAVTIPSGLTAHTAAGEQTPGFGIVLSWQPRVYLQVSAGYDVFYDLTAAAVHQRDVQGLRLHDTLLEERSAQTMLDGVPAERNNMRFQCPGDAQIYLHEGLIVVRNREIYRLDLQTVPQRAAQDEALLEAMQRSWHWVSVPKSF